MSTRSHVFPQQLSKYEILQKFIKSTSEYELWIPPTSISHATVRAKRQGRAQARGAISRERMTRQNLSRHEDVWGGAGVHESIESILQAWSNLNGIQQHEACGNILAILSDQSLV